MAIFKCKMCGGTIEFENGATVGVCDSCGTKQTLPRLDDDRRANLYDRANHFRRNNDFDKAAGIYEQILNEDNTDAEAYWSLVLCRYGIEYVEDPKTHKRIPTVNRAQFTSIYMDEDYKSALSYADAYQKQIYEEEAKSIDEIQKGILEISSKEEPFDVFICYKETDLSGKRTQDSVLATELYHQLTQEGFKVFFAAITLEDKLGSAYEPYIFAALNSAKVMVVLGTKPEYFNAVWVKNEWSRYLSLVKNSGGKKMLIPAYKDMDPYDLPEEFSHLQAQDMAKLGFMQDLVRGIKKIIYSTPQNQTVKAATSSAAPLLERAFLFLEDGKWQDANTYCEKVLDLEPKNALAYLGKLMAEFQVKNRKDLADCQYPFDDSEIYLKIIRFGDEKLKNELNGYIANIKKRNENALLTNRYNDAVTTMRSAKTVKKFEEAADKFLSISGFKDSDELLIACNKQIEQLKIKEENERLQAAREAEEKRIKEENERLKAAREAEKKRIEEEREAKEKRIREEKLIKKRKKIRAILIFGFCTVVAFTILLITEIIPNSKYNEAMRLYNAGKYTEAMDIFKALNGYKDSAKIYAQYEIEKIRTADVGDIVTFGVYEQDNDKFNGKEQLEWIVLDKDDGSLFLISDKALDEQPYHNKSYTGITWDNCSLRKWLNSNFLKDAFSSEEQQYIKTTYVTADKNPNSSADPGNDTEDKIFLLSITELNKYFNGDQARKCVGTAYSEARGLLLSDDENTCFWLLRTPGSNYYQVAAVQSWGPIYYEGVSVSIKECGVRPAMWISLN